MEQTEEASCVYPVRIVEVNVNVTGDHVPGKRRRSL